MTNNSFVGISDRYTALQTLRAGDTNKTVDALESQMNGEILQFAAMKLNVPVAKLKPADIRLITRVRDYRTAHPYTEGTPEIDQTVASILSLTNKTMWLNK
jgi:hypothetical protein